MMNFCSHCHEVPKPSIMLLNFHLKKCSTYLPVLFNIVYKAIQDMNRKLCSYILQTHSPQARMSV